MTVASYRYDDDPEPRRRLAGGWVFWGILAIVSVLIIGTSLVPSDYVIERPGEVHDVLGTIEVDGNPVALIDIPSQQTYPTTGSLDMLTVSTLGNPDRTPSWFQVAQAWIIGASSLYGPVSARRSRLKSRKDCATAQSAPWAIRYSSTSRSWSVTPAQDARLTIQNRREPVNFPSW